MGLFRLFYGLSVVFLAVNASNIHEQNGDSDLGEPLYLTKYIENGDIETAQKLSRVNHPDFPLENYAGYFTVNKTFNSNMFFWYFPAKENADNAPVLLYLMGGPGGPSLPSIFVENGPYFLTESNELKPNEHSWHLNHNLLYIDNPVGVGYSFTDSDDGFSTNQVDVGQNLLSALQQFFVMFPKLQKNEFFPSGVSYAGKYVPAIGYAIYKDSKRETDEPLKPKINLKGLIIANGWVDPINQINFADYLYQYGMIDSNGHKQFEEKQNQMTNLIKQRDFQNAFVKMEELLYGSATIKSSIYTNLTGLTNTANILKTDVYMARWTSILEFLQRSDIRRAIHVGNNTLSVLGKAKEMLHSDFMVSVADWVSELLSYYPILFYNGQYDLICAYPMTVNFLNHLQFSSANEYKTAERHIWRVDNELAGYIKQAGNLTEVLVRDSAHTAVVDQPKWVLDLLLKFTQHKSFH